MSKIVLYDNTKTYMYPNGKLATPESVKAQYPATESFTHIIETDNSGEVLFAIQNLSAARTTYGIDASLTAEEAITAIEEIVNTPQETEMSAESRIASALEYQIIMSM